MDNPEFEFDLFALPREGRITLQIPTIQIDIIETEDGPRVFSEETNPATLYPKEWFAFLLGEGREPAVGREDSFIFWSKKGWEANKDKIKEVFEEAMKEPMNDRSNPGEQYDWAAFEEFAEECFESRKKRLAKKKKLLQNKLDQYDKAEI